MVFLPSATIFLCSFGFEMGFSVVTGDAPCPVTDDVDDDEDGGLAVPQRLQSIL